MATGQFFCPTCKRVRDAHVLSWGDPYLAEFDVTMGPSFWHGDESIPCYQRARKCSVCDALIETVEVDDALIYELQQLREANKALRSESKAAAQASRAVHRKLNGWPYVRGPKARRR
jgi:hypothetical protein